MSTDLEARIAEVLEEHDFDPSRLVSSIVACSCNQWAQDLPQGRGRYAAHREHVAAMLAPVIREAQAEAWDKGAFDASMSLDHGGHNADNPYRSNDE